VNPELERFIDEELKSKGYGVKHVEVSLDALQDDVLNLMIAAKNIIGLMPIKEGVNVFQFMQLIKGNCLFLCLSIIYSLLSFYVVF